MAFNIYMTIRGDVRAEAPIGAEAGRLAAGRIRSGS